MEIIQIVDKQLNQLVNTITGEDREYSYFDWKLLKSKFSSKVLAEKLKINEGMLNEFESTLEQYNQQYDIEETNITCAFRVALWLETIFKNLAIPIHIKFQHVESDEEIAIKQVRAIELIFRSLILEKIGTNESLTQLLSELFKPEIIEKWQKSSDESGILSGTTFSELSNIFLSKNLFAFFEPIFISKKSRITNKAKDSLRFLLEDIRIIRNGIAHNKQLSTIQIEALNNHFQIITDQIDHSKECNIEIKAYFDKANANILGYLNSLKEDQSTISGYLDEINEKSSEILGVSNKINRKTTIIISLIFILLIITGLVLYYQKDSSQKTREIHKSTKKIEENVQQVFNRFDQLEGALKSSNPIANPKTANDFIVNAYVFKNAGESAKSIEMFQKYFAKTNNNKFDLYLDYYDVMKYHLSIKLANNLMRELSDQDLAQAVILYNNEYGIESWRGIEKLKLSNQLKNYLFVIKSSEMKSEYISWAVFPFWIKVINKRKQLGIQFEEIQTEFFNKNRPLELLFANHWDNLKNDIIIYYESQQFVDKGWDKDLYKMDYWTSLRNLIGTSDVATDKNINACIDFSSNPRYVKILKSMP